MQNFRAYLQNVMLTNRKIYLVELCIRGVLYILSNLPPPPLVFWYNCALVPFKDKKKYKFSSLGDILNISAKLQGVFAKRHVD